MTKLFREKAWCLLIILIDLFFFRIYSQLQAFEFNSNKSGIITGELKQWHPLSITFEGPETSETEEYNPFLNYRLQVTFRKENKEYTVPGFYAADGDAANSGADSGNKWRVYFTPDETGIWTYTVSFRKGPQIAVNPDPQAGEPVYFDGARGSFKVSPSDKSGRDFRSKGMLKYVGKHYLQFSGSGEYFIKGGADSPENFLAYFEFDGTRALKKISQKKRSGEAKTSHLHRYQPHVADWKKGDPTWKNGLGKGIIGALNYLAGKGMNSVYFLTMNVQGDGQDVWPWIAPDQRLRFDCSKLDQWEIVFSHMDRLGLMMHLITQEQENDQLLDGGDLGIERKLYYRELIARFSHHLGLVWNLGEENTNTNEQRKSFATYFKKNDPYQHPVVVHTFPNKYNQVYTPLLGFEYFDGASLQIGDMKKTHSVTIKWVERSDSSSHSWIVCLDEIGPAHTGVKPDIYDFWHDKVRRYALWGNLMAGGAGCEWYFGYNYPHNDLTTEDWQSRDNMWNLTRHALEFFNKYLPFWEMHSADELTDNPDDYVFAKKGEIYAIYLPEGKITHLNLVGFSGRFSVRWYNPRNGGKLQKGTIETIKAGSSAVEIGYPPIEKEKDWVGLIRKM